MLSLDVALLYSIVFTRSTEELDPLSETGGGAEPVFSAGRSGLEALTWIRSTIRCAYLAFQ